MPLRGSAPGRGWIATRGRRTATCGQQGGYGRLFSFRERDVIACATDLRYARHRATPDPSYGGSCALRPDCVVGAFRRRDCVEPYKDKGMVSEAFSRHFAGHRIASEARTIRMGEPGRALRQSRGCAEKLAHQTHDLFRALPVRQSRGRVRGVTCRHARVLDCTRAADEAQLDKCRALSDRKPAQGTCRARGRAEAGGGGTCCPASRTRWRRRRGPANRWPIALMVLRCDPLAIAFVPAPARRRPTQAACTRPRWIARAIDRLQVLRRLINKMAVE